MTDSNLFLIIYVIKMKSDGIKFWETWLLPGIRWKSAKYSCCGCVMEMLHETSFAS